MSKRANGEGSKPRKKPNGRYEARATVDTPNGRRRVSFYGATAKEAAEKRTAAIADRNRGALFVDPGRLAVGEYLTRWLSDTARYQVAASTHGRYRREKNHLGPFFGAVKMRDLSPAHVRAFKALKLDEGLNPNTVGNLQSLLSGVMAQAVDDGLVASNPCSRVKKAAARGKAPIRALSHEEASGLTACAAGTPEEALIVLALKTGMRQGELAALRWEDLDLDGPRPSVAVRRSADTRTKTVVSATKTGEERTLRLGPRVVATLKAHRSRQRERRMAATTWEDPGWVFSNGRGKVRRRDSVMRSFRRLLDEAGLPGAVRFHDLRHTTATLAIRGGRPIPEVAKLLGHSDSAMTPRRYSHVLEEMEDDTARDGRDVLRARRPGPTPRLAPTDPYRIRFPPTPPGDPGGPGRRGQRPRPAPTYPLEP